MSKQLPKYFKDAEGFCYVATEALAKVSHLTPWDGAIDKRGFVVEAPVDQKAKRQSRATPSE